MKLAPWIATLALMAALHAADSKSTEPDAGAAFARLKTLAGEWEAKTPDGRAHVTYELTGAGTTLVERDAADNMPGMMTMYHMNGKQLLLTHYCMAGNQPRMQARRYDPGTGELRFEFLDATNLKTPNDGHMHNVTIRIVDHDHFISQWEFYENGQKKMSESFEYTRVH